MEGPYPWLLNNQNAASSKIKRILSIQVKVLNFSFFLRHPRVAQNSTVGRMRSAGRSLSTPELFRERFYKYEMCSKSIKTEAVFIKTEIDNEWNVNFLQSSLCGIQHIYSGQFSTGQNISETPRLILSEGVPYFF